MDFRKTFLEGVEMRKDYWVNRNVFVSGCTGLLGSWLVKELLRRGANIVGLIRDWVPRSNLILQDSINKITAVRGEIENYSLLERVVNEYEIETVFHLAAQTIVGIANKSPLSTFEANIKGTWNILEACRHIPTVKRIILASSDKAYGSQKELPYEEDLPLQGRYPYDVSKSCADLLGKSYFSTYKLPLCITRCGNFYGGGDLNFNRIVPGTIRSVLFNERPIIRSDGLLTRDYIHIEDAVEGYLHLAEFMDNSKIYGEAFNFSNEKPSTVLEIVNLILEIMHSKLKPKILNAAKNEIRDQYLSAKKAKKILNWSPKVGLEEGLKKTIEWYKWFFKKND